MYKTVIFDLYGTLIDIHTDEGDAQLWQTLSFHFRYSGVPIDAQELYREFHEEIGRQMSCPKTPCEFPDFVMEETFEAIAARKGVKPGRAWAEETVRWLRLLSMRRLALYDGVEETLLALREKGCKLYLLSNGQKTFVEAELRVLGLDKLLDGIAISSEAGISKPDPLFYRYLADTYGADLSSAVMIGNDHTTDVEGARRAGIDAIYIHSNSSPDATQVDCKYQIWDGQFRRILDFV